MAGGLNSCCGCCAGLGAGGLLVIVGCGDGLSLLLGAGCGVCPCKLLFCWHGVHQQGVMLVPKSAQHFFSMSYPGVCVAAPWSVHTMLLERFHTPSTLRPPSAK